MASRRERAPGCASDPGRPACGSRGGDVAAADHHDVRPTMRNSGRVHPTQDPCPGGGDKVVSIPPLRVTSHPQIIPLQMADPRYESSRSHRLQALRTFSSRFRHRPNRCYRPPQTKHTPICPVQLPFAYDASQRRSRCRRSPSRLRQSQISPVRPQALYPPVHKPDVAPAFSVHLQGVHSDP